MTATRGVKALLGGKPVVIAMGVTLFTAALETQGVRVVHVAWTPPAGGDQEMLALLADLL